MLLLCKPGLHVETEAVTLVMAVAQAVPIACAAAEAAAVIWSLVTVLPSCAIIPCHY